MAAKKGKSQWASWRTSSLRSAISGPGSTNPNSSKASRKEQPALRAELRRRGLDDKKIGGRLKKPGSKGKSKGSGGDGK